MNSRRSIRREPPAFVSRTVRIFWPVIVGDRYLEEFLADQSPETKNLLRYANRSASQTVKMYLDAFHAVELIDLSYFAANKYPWRDSTITRTEHLDMVWHYFTGATYLYLERNKTFLNTINKLICTLDLGEKENVGRRMTEIREHLGEYIRSRGMMFHEYTIMHDSVHTLAMVSVLAESDPIYAGRVDGFFQDAKYELRRQIIEARAFCLQDFAALTERLTSRLEKIVATSEGLQRQHLGDAVVELKGLSRPKSDEWI